MTGNGGTGSDLGAILLAGGAIWPDFGLTLDDLQGYAETTALAESALQHAPDVVLVCACLKGVGAAVSALDRMIRENAPIFLKRIDRDPEFAREICQRLQERLLRGKPPRLATYNGSGPLLNWLRVMTVRLAVDVKRAQPPVSNMLAESFAEHMAAESAGPDLQILKERYGPSLLDAVSGGLKALPRRQRAVLRLYLLANLTTDEIGRMYDVHRSTVARWIAGAERSIFDSVKAQFREKWGLETRDVASLARLIRSQLPLSLEKML
jgi:RNA polymerase sigma-70 factor (ECF subfamily)